MAATGPPYNVAVNHSVVSTSMDREVSLLLKPLQCKVASD